MKISHSPLMFSVSLAVVMALSACGKNASDTPAAAPVAPPVAQPATTPAPAATTAMAAAPAVVSVASVDLGNAIDGGSKVTTAADSFAPKDTIYASIATTGSGTAKFDARWTYQDGQTVKEDSKTIAPTGPAETEFHISKPGGWPLGNYKVEISLNGQSVATKDFSVK